MAKIEKLYEIIDKENFEPGGTLEERVSVLEEVLQEQVMTAKKGLYKLFRGFVKISFNEVCGVYERKTIIILHTLN